MDQQPHDVIPPVNLPRPNEVPNFSIEHPTEISSSVALEQNLQPQPLSMPGQQTSPFQPLPAQIPPATVTADPSQLTSTYPGAPQIADDADLIEKEWVEKAKQIVEQTKNDPYLQNQEMNKIKADYMKKRYNKDLKLS